MRSISCRALGFAGLPLFLAACGSGPSMTSDAGGTDGGTRDGGARDGGVDANEADASPDAAPLDGGPMGTVFPERDFVCASGMTPVCMTTEPATTDVERTEVVEDVLGGATFVFVVAEWSAPRATGGVAAGFNLDGLDSGAGSTSSSANCEELNGDFVSALDPMHVGVDNTFAAIVGALESFIDPSECPGGTSAGCLDFRVADAIAEGALLLLIQIDGVDDLANDTEVSVALHVAALTGGGAPMLDGSGRLVPDQLFDVVATLGADESADVFRGRLRAQLATWDWPAAVPAGVVFIPGLGGDLGSVELRADVSTTALANGHLGGHASIDEAISSFGPLDAGREGTLRSLLGAIADIAPSAADPTICDRLSVGYLVSGVPAMLGP